MARIPYPTAADLQPVTLEELAKIRYPIYREADFDFDTTHLTHEDLVEKIINNIQNPFDIANSGKTLKIIKPNYIR